MIYLIAGLVIFFGNHSIRIVMPQWRARFIENYGTNTWRVIYSLFSIGGLILIIYGYSGTRTEPVFLWNPPLWTRHIALLLTWLAFILLAASGIKGNLFKSKLGHPMYAGIKIWAFAHLLANGRLGDVLLFGTFLLWAIVGFSLSRRQDKRAGIAYPAGNSSKTILTVVAGSIAWAIFAFWLHLLLIGVSPLPI